MLALGGAFEAIDELKGRLVRRMAERTRRIESGEQIVVGVNALHRDRAVAARRRRSNILKVDPAVEAELIADVAGVARRPRRRRRRSARSTSCAGWPSRGEQHHAGHHRPGPRRRHHRRVGRGACARCSASTGRPTGVAAAGGPPATRELAAVAERVKAHGRRPAPAPGGQARPRRPLQRRRADRRGRPRRRHGGRLPGHPPHARADRGVGPRRGPRRDRPVDPVGQPPRAGARRRCALLRAEGVDAPVVVGGIIPEDDRPAAAGRRASPRSTRRRTSSWAGSWATSPTWRWPTARGDAGRLGPASSGRSGGCAVVRPAPWRRRAVEQRRDVVAAARILMAGLAILFGSLISLIATSSATVDAELLGDLRSESPAGHVSDGTDGRGRRRRRRGRGAAAWAAASWWSTLTSSPAAPGSRADGDGHVSGHQRPLVTRTPRLPACSLAALAVPAWPRPVPAVRPASRPARPASVAA